jgi:hypothetical protein
MGVMDVRIARIFTRFLRIFVRKNLVKIRAIHAIRTSISKSKYILNKKIIR